MINDLRGLFWASPFWSSRTSLYPCASCVQQIAKKNKIQITQFSARKLSYFYGQSYWMFSAQCLWSYDKITIPNAYMSWNNVAKTLQLVHKTDSIMAPKPTKSPSTSSLRNGNWFYGFTGKGWWKTIKIQRLEFLVVNSIPSFPFTSLDHQLNQPLPEEKVP